MAERLEFEKIYGHILTNKQIIITEFKRLRYCHTCIAGMASAIVKLATQIHEQACQPLDQSRVLFLLTSCFFLFSIKVSCTQFFVFSRNLICKTITFYYILFYPFFVQFDEVLRQNNFNMLIFIFWYYARFFKCNSCSVARIKLKNTEVNHLKEFA